VSNGANFGHVFVSASSMLHVYFWIWCICVILFLTGEPWCLWR